MRTRTKYNPKASVYEYDNPIQYIKDVLDSKTPSVDGWDLDGHTILSRRYSNLQDEKAKRIIAKAIVQLLDDSDYSCDAIPVASELGLEEAKDWFLNLSKKSLEEIRCIKTNGYTNALYCLLNFILNQYDKVFLSSIKRVLNESKDRLEVMRAFTVFSELEPDLALKQLSKHLLLILDIMEEQKKVIAFNETTWGFYKKYGDIFCIELAEKLKSCLKTEDKIAFYESITQNPTPRFKPYLEELKKILEINE